VLHLLFQVLRAAEVTSAVYTVITIPGVTPLVSGTPILFIQEIFYSIFDVHSHGYFNFHVLLFSVCEMGFVRELF